MLASRPARGISELLHTCSQLMYINIPKSTKVQWNTMLFRNFIPRTWSCLVEEMVTKELVSDIFSIWPPESCAGELESYYSSLSENFVGALLAAKAAVWPIYELQNQFRNLESLVVASPTEPQSVLRALANVGVSLTRPPSYIFDILHNSPESRILNQEVAHGLLLVCPLVKMQQYI